MSTFLEHLRQRQQLRKTEPPKPRELPGCTKEELGRAVRPPPAAPKRQVRGGYGVANWMAAGAERAKQQAVARRQAALRSTGPQAGAVTKSELAAGAAHHYARMEKALQLGLRDQAARHAHAYCVYERLLGADPQRAPSAAVAELLGAEAGALAKSAAPAAFQPFRRDDALQLARLWPLAKARAAACPTCGGQRCQGRGCRPSKGLDKTAPPVDGGRFSNRPGGDRNDPWDRRMTEERRRKAKPHTFEPHHDGGTSACKHCDNYESHDLHKAAIPPLHPGANRPRLPGMTIRGGGESGTFDHKRAGLAPMRPGGAPPAPGGPAVAAARGIATARQQTFGAGTAATAPATPAKAAPATTAPKGGGATPAKPKGARPPVTKAEPEPDAAGLWYYHKPEDGPAEVGDYTHEAQDVLPRRWRLEVHTTHPPEFDTPWHNGVVRDHTGEVAGIMHGVDGEVSGDLPGKSTGFTMDHPIWSRVAQVLRGVQDGTVTPAPKLGRTRPRPRTVN